MKECFRAPWLGIALHAAAFLLCACSEDSQPAQKISAAPEQLAQGKYLVVAADCAACHTAENGAPFAGGVPLDTPFGTMYGSNITPDPDYGIGRWTRDQFYSALTRGRGHGLHYLYPAMPYTSYRALPRADSDAMYDYLMSRQSVAVPGPEAKLGFPYNIRLAMMGWNILFLKNELPAASEGQSEAWQRGRYLVNVLGHCAECHTPRGRLGQLDLDNMNKGSTLGRFEAPDITPQGLAARGWNVAGLRALMKTGVAPQGSVYSEMYTVVHLSTQHLNDVDLNAMVTFLLGDQPPAPQALMAVSADATTMQAGRRSYVSVCAGCHGYDGEGKPEVAVAMLGNSTLRLPNPHNLVVSILDGLPAQRFPGLASMQEMPGFADQLSDEEVADLANYLRATWGGQAADVRAEAVNSLRRK